ncbi:hypothetical protein [Kitasatospora purpeofusca]|uniref:hypothetical protein n=1 Tax=Kitasatospora purpeofusca TaxID=67352 RepID=UPI002259EE75|nr:hypothetical protein [Kitasatospora purpeofusca]MCX4759270.1 hypothetical protein [Kitasatospora purpeofusca]WSR30333.1 hypothetical protein OG715_04810 [Kitasatospora purpeofusca]
MSTPRPDSDPAPAPAPVAAADGDADRTVGLDPAGEGGTETVRLGAGPAAQGPVVEGPAVDGPDAEATLRIDPDEAVSATFLDPGVWGGAGETVEALTLLDTPAHGTAAPAVADPALTVTAPVAGPPSQVAAPGPPPADLAPTVPDTALTVTAPASASVSASVPPGATPPPGPPPAPATSASSSAVSAASAVADSEDGRPLAPGELRRFGPGVPPLAAAVWHGAAVPGAEPPRRRRARRWLFPLVLLLAVLALLFWRFSTPALAVTGVGVTTDPAGPGCDSVAVIKAEVETNGGAGTLRYRWLRSDGTTSAEIGQDIGSGTHRTELVLRWSFEGRGSLAATATLEILAPGSRTAEVSFPYHCA